MIDKRGFISECIMCTSFLVGAAMLMIPSANDKKRANDPDKFVVGHTYRENIATKTSEGLQDPSQQTMQIVKLENGTLMTCKSAIVESCGVALNFCTDGRSYRCMTNVSETNEQNLESQ